MPDIPNEYRNSDSDEVRPRLPRQYKEEIENIHYTIKKEEPQSFVEAVATTCSLAYEAIDQGLVDEQVTEILPEDWQSERLDDAHIRLIDEQLPETWKDSRLVAERIQSVVYHYLTITLGNSGLRHADTFDSDDGEITTRAAIKEAMERTRVETDPKMSLSAIRSSCHRRVFADKQVSYAAEFENALENIQAQIQEQGLTVPGE